VNDICGDTKVKLCQ